MNTKLATSLVVGALLVPVAGYAAEKSMTQNTKEAVSDSVITTKIKADFAKDKTVSAMSIKVDTDAKGVVTLSGNAKSQAEVDQAMKIAKETKGVTSVTNNMTVGDASAKKSMTQGAKDATANVKEAVSDSVITVKIKAEFAKDKAVSATSIKVDTEDKGVVTLGGTAKSKAEVDQAVKIAKETKGVTAVHSNITVQAK